MPEDIASIVGSSLASMNESVVSDADIPDEGGGDAVETSDAPEESTSAEVVESPTSGEKPAKADAAPAPDDIDVFMQKHGMHKKPNGEWSALPHRRARKMLENFKKRADSERESAVKEYKDKLTAHEKKVLGLGLTGEGLDKLIESDPEKYLRSLAALHPDKYSRFLQEHQKVVARAAEAANEDDDMPQPDVRDKDGNPTGYTLDGFRKVTEWLRKKAEDGAYQRAMADSDKKFGPILKEHQTREFIESVKPDVQKKWDDAAELWGQPFVDDANKGEQSEVLKLMKTGMTFESAVQKVMVPLLRADRTKMRTEIHGELEARPGAASSTTASASKSAASGPATIESIVGGVLSKLRR